MASTRILIRSGTVVDLAHERGFRENCDVLIAGDRIEAIGTGLEAPDADVIDARGSIVAPGFIDTHRHMWQGQLTSAAVDLTLGDYFGQLIATVAPRYRPEDVRVGELVSGLDCIAAGITTVFDFSHIQHTPAHTDAAIAGLRESGVRAVFGYGFPLDDLGAWMWESTLRAPEDVRRVKEEHFGSGDALLTLGMSLRGPEYSTMDVVADDLDLARDLGVGVSLHIGGAESGPKYRGVTRMGEMGLLGPDICFVHGNTIGDTEFELIRASGGTISVTPAVEAQMGHGYPATARARRLGLTIGLGSDVPTSTSTSMFDMMRVAFAMTRAAEIADGASDLVSAREILSWATIDAARTIGLEDTVGSLSAGKQADVIIVSMPESVSVRATDPISVMMSSASVADVRTVLVGGEVRKHDGMLVGVDREAVAAAADHSVAHLLAG